MLTVLVQLYPADLVFNCIVVLSESFFFSFPCASGDPGQPGVGGYPGLKGNQGRDGIPGSPGQKGDTSKRIPQEKSLQLSQLVFFLSKPLASRKQCISRLLLKLMCDFISPLQI